MDINIVNSFIRFLTIIKYHHWATSVYNTHKITDTMHADFSLFVDDFVEAYMGSSKNRVPQGSNVECRFTVPSTNKNFLSICEGFNDFLSNLKTKKDMTPQLINKIDEMLAKLDQYMFLLRLE